MVEAVADIRHANSVLNIGMAPQPATPLLTLVVPFYNEEAMVRHFSSR